MVDTSLDNELDIVDAPLDKALLKVMELEAPLLELKLMELEAPLLELKLFHS